MAREDIAHATGRVGIVELFLRVDKMHQIEGAWLRRLGAVGCIDITPSLCAVGRHPFDPGIQIKVAMANALLRTATERWELKVMVHAGQSITWPIVVCFFRALLFDPCKDWP